MLILRKCTVYNFQLDQCVFCATWPRILINILDSAVFPHNPWLTNSILLPQYDSRSWIQTKGMAATSTLQRVLDLVIDFVKALLIFWSFTYTATQ